MKLRLFALALLSALVATSAAPMAAADKETRQMMADIRMLQEQEQQIQSALTALTDAVKAMNTGVNARIDEQTETTRKALADQKTVTTSISTDLRALREKVDDVTTRLGQQAGEIQAVRQLITSRTPVAALAPAPDAGGGPAPDNSASAAPASPAAQGASPTAMYNSAYGDYTASLFDLAIDGFKAFINSYPTHPQAPDAQAYICTSYIQWGKFQEAVDACDTEIRNYPKAGVTPMAYYRKGLALMELKETAAANAAFDYIEQTWPDSQEAALAKQKHDPKKP